MTIAGQKSNAVGQFKSGQRKAPEKEAPGKGVSATRIRHLFPEEQYNLLKSLPVHIIKKAWFTAAHLLLDDDAVVADIGCQNGAMAYALAVLQPTWTIIGVDLNPHLIRHAETTYQRPNLSFRVGNIYEDALAENSTDAIINSFLLHEIYSDSQYNDNLIERTLERQYRALKENGFLLVRDHTMPPPGEYVLMELKDLPSKSASVEQMSEPDLLIWFSEKARSGHHADGAGFFLEELPARYPNTRLFRLPYKWAKEFILRKDERVKLEEELAKEYAFITEHDLRRTLRGLGARITYSAPHWDSAFVKSRYERKVWMYRDDGVAIGPPPTSHLVVAQKIGKNKSQVLHERRNARQKVGQLTVTAVRDDRTGQISDIVSRNLEIAEIIPYRITPDHELKIYLHDGKPRGLVNAVPRNGKNLDGKRWSGHMTEAIAVEAEKIHAIKDAGPNELQKFSRLSLGFRPANDGTGLQKGPGFYPDPYKIDERIETFFMRIEEAVAPFAPREVLSDTAGFSSVGRIREYDAQAILNALAVGYLPNSRLEIQIMALYEMLGLKFTTWADLPLQLSEVPVEEEAKIQNVLARLAVVDDRFRTVRGNAGTIRVVNSVFVDEGRDEGGGMTGLAARDIEFIVPEDNTINTAVVLPLVKDLNGEVLAGVTAEYLPVPQRYKGTGMTLTAPSFALPKEVTDMDGARRFVAEQFKVEPKFVAPMGESYFIHIGVTPHRIYPFVVTNMKPAFRWITNGITQYTSIKRLWKLCYWDNCESFMRLVARTYKTFSSDSSDLTNKWSFEQSFSAELSRPRGMESSMAPGSGSLSVPSNPLDDHKSSSGSTTTQSGSGDKGKVGGTSGFGGPNDDVMGSDFDNKRGGDAKLGTLSRQPR